jgi:hypothetical protein
LNEAMKRLWPIFAVYAIGVAASYSMSGMDGGKRDLGMALLWPWNLLKGFLIRTGILSVPKLGVLINSTPTTGSTEPLVTTVNQPAPRAEPTADS